MAIKLTLERKKNPEFEMEHLINVFKDQMAHALGATRKPPPPDLSPQATLLKKHVTEMLVRKVDEKIVTQIH